jgi:hypothetical protein
MLPHSKLLPHSNPTIHYCIVKYFFISKIGGKIVWESEFFARVSSFHHKLFAKKKTIFREKFRETTQAKTFVPNPSRKSYRPTELYDIPVPYLG